MTAQPELAAVTPALPWPAGDPYPAYERLRAEHGAVHFDEGSRSWIVLGHAAAREVLRGEGWSNDPAASRTVREQMTAAGMEPEIFRGLLVFLDPPDHTRIRSALRSSFTPAAISRLRDRVDEIAAAPVDPLPTGEPIDVMGEIARPFPIAVIAEWLDLGVEGAQVLWTESPALVRMLDLDPRPDEVAAAAGAFTALMAHLLPLAAARRQRPSDDLLSVLAANEEVALDEVVTTALVLAIAGHETTANLIGNGLLTLMQQPGGATATLVDAAAIEELLRLVGPAQAVGRTALVDQEVAGTKIAAGDRLLVVVAAANRDPEAYAYPDEYEPGREGPPALAFGLGRHHCIGASLARLEAAVVLDRVAARRPVLADDDIGWRPTTAIRGTESLWVTLEA